MKSLHVKNLVSFCFITLKLAYLQLFDYQFNIENYT
ncbi:MAG: hypothetical protein JWP71_108 [Mucilaginibacter sp.]|nr:hypothetical protein [Mucilaginibacter sp.]